MEGMEHVYWPRCQLDKVSSLLHEIVSADPGASGEGLNVPNDYFGKGIVGVYIYCPRG